jgi:hypothetical protein
MELNIRGNMATLPLKIDTWEYFTVPDRFLRTAFTTRKSATLPKCIANELPLKRQRIQVCALGVFFDGFLNVESDG